MRCNSGDSDYPASDFKDHVVVEDKGKATVAAYSYFDVNLRLLEVDSAGTEVLGSLRSTRPALKEGVGMTITIKFLGHKVLSAGRTPHYGMSDRHGSAKDPHECESGTESLDPSCKDERRNKGEDSHTENPCDVGPLVSWDDEYSDHGDSTST